MGVSLFRIQVPSSADEVGGRTHDCYASLLIIGDCFKHLSVLGDVVAVEISLHDARHRTLLNVLVLQRLHVFVTHILIKIFVDPEELRVHDSRVTLGEHAPQGLEGGGYAGSRGEERDEGDRVILALVPEPVATTLKGDLISLLKFPQRLGHEIGGAGLGGRDEDVEVALGSGRRYGKESLLENLVLRLGIDRTQNKL